MPELWHAAEQQASGAVAAALEAKSEHPLAEGHPGWQGAEGHDPRNIWRTFRPCPATACRALLAEQDCCWVGSLMYESALVLCYPGNGRRRRERSGSSRAKPRCFLLTTDGKLLGIVGCGGHRQGRQSDEAIRQLKTDGRSGGHAHRRQRPHRRRPFGQQAGCGPGYCRCAA